MTFCDGLCYEAADNIAIARWLKLLMVDVDFCTDAHPLYAQMRCAFPPEFRAVLPLSLDIYFSCKQQEMFWTS